MTEITMSRALELFETGYRRLIDEQPKFYYSQGKSFKSHCCLVACCAEIIASRLPHIDGRKAYIYGLLHDYGKMIKDADNEMFFHGLTGYDEFMKIGYPDIAKICLTHSFTNKDFKLSDYSYPHRDLQKTRRLLSKMEYDDYDRLIQLCDLLILDFDFKTLRERIEFIKLKYRVSSLMIKRKYREALHLKSYFDKLCGCDIYSLLGVKS